jgi:hypothetical protein
MDTNPEDETSYTIQYQQAFLKNVENHYCAKHRLLLVKKLDSLPKSNPIPSAMVTGSCQSSCDSYDFSSDDEEWLTLTKVADITLERSDLSACLLTAPRLPLHLPPEAPKNCGQINPNLNIYHSDQMEICSTFWVPDTTDWLRQQEETPSKYTDFCYMPRNTFSIIPHRIGLEASFSPERDVIGWRQSKTAGKTLHNEVVVRQFALANNRIQAGADPELKTKNTENHSEIQKEAEERKLHRITMVDDFMVMWQGSQNLPATQKVGRGQHKQMPSVS